MDLGRGGVRGADVLISETGPMSNVVSGSPRRSIRVGWFICLSGSV